MNVLLSFIYLFLLKLRSILRNILPFWSYRLLSKIRVHNKGMIIGSSKVIRGKNNFLSVGYGSKLIKCTFHIIGNNNQIIIGRKCHIGCGCEFRIEGDNIKIEIDDNTTVVRDSQFCAQEKGCSILVGKDCMLSNNIMIRTSDSHPIFDQATKQRINPAKSINIGNHVWIAAKATIMKGVTIGNGSIVGYSSIVTKDMPENSIIIGAPARSLKSNCYWTRDKIF